MLKKTLLMLLLVSMSMSMVSCSDDNPDDPIIPVTCNDIDNLLNLAYRSLEAKMYDLTEPDAVEPDRPSDIDFSVTRGLYQDAYDCDNNNLEACFGLAFTEMLSLTMNQDVNDAFDAWDAYLQDASPFEVPNKSSSPLGFNLNVRPGRTSVELPFDVVSSTMLAHVKAMMAGTEPQIVDIQDILWDVVRPKATLVSSLLAPVAAAANFKFTVSGEMQGDAYSDDIEMDHTDMLVCMAGVRLLQAAVYVATAYDVQMASYDSTGIMTGFNQANGNMMTLKSGAAANLSQVPTIFQAAVDDLSSAITSLLAETDAQGNDWIKIDPYDLTEADLIDLRDNILPDVRSAMGSGGVVVTEDWDGDGTTADQDMRINMYAFFNDPVIDWKKKLPAYSLSVIQVPCDVQYNRSDDETDTVNLTVPADFNNYWAYGGIDIDHFELGEMDHWNQSFPALDDAYWDLADDILLEMQAIPDWSGEGWIHFTVNNLEPGVTKDIVIEWYYSYELALSWLYAPKVTWVANDVDTWFSSVPDPDFNGLLPDFTSGTQYINFFDIDTGGWEKEMRIEWEFDCNYSSNPIQPILNPAR